ncbi:MAG: discoidin domain-containing protein, partial [Bacteroidota bacterium]
MKKINIVLFAVLLFSMPINALAQVSDNPCQWDKLTNLLGPHLLIKQSTTFEEAAPAYAIDGTTSASWLAGNVSRTTVEENAWLEIDLGAVYALGAIEVWYPTDLYPAGLNDYYILVARDTFPSTDLSVLLTQEDIYSLYVIGTLASASTIPLGFPSGRYVRLQKANRGFLAFSEIIIPGTDIEICDNGEDDDCDGKVDCEDSDCSPNVSNIDLSQAPSCQACSDGAIRIQADREGIKYSIDGGQTYQEDPLFEDLAPGDYTIVVLNGQTGCRYEESVRLEATAGEPNDCCANGDFEQGNFENWEGGSGFVEEDGEVVITENEIVDDFGFDSFHVVISEEDDYEDPAIPNLPVFSNTTGDFVARLGRKEAGRKAERLTYEFEVEECNTNFRFNYMVVGEDPPDGDHGVEDNGFFEFRIYDVENPDESIKISKATVNVNNNIFTVGDKIGDLSIVYTNWICESVDLSEFVGEKVVAEFTVADCVEGAHWCYAYISGLCNAAQAMVPVVDLEEEAVYCSNQAIEVDASSSLGYTRFGWTVCALDDLGQPVDCVTYDALQGGILGLFDAGAYYQEGGEVLVCGQDYRISLTLENDSGPAV